MPRIGAHLSIAGGLPRAIDRAVASGCEALQIFTKSVGRWRARPLPPEEVAEFRRKVAQSGVRPIVAHNSYLTNVGAADPALRERSIEALIEELDRADALGLYGLVMHPGSYTIGTESDGLALIADALGRVLSVRPSARCRILLEHTAGQGTNLGHRFEQLATIIERLGGSPRVGVCLDTCHLLVAGYDIRTEEGYAETFRQFASILGLRRLKLFHLNDSKRPCGARVDRHEHIGKGCVGLAAFRRLLNDPRFAKLPMLLETPKSELREHARADLDPLDQMNLTTLRRLRLRPSRQKPAPRI